MLLARQGYAVGVNYLRDESAARQVVAEIEAQGGKALALQADVADEAQVMAMFDALDAGLGTLSALVNNAGILFQQANIEQLTAERINQVLSTNVTGYFLCCREAVKRMALRHGGQGGAIVNVSSAASRLGAAGEYVDYAASKGAVDTLTIGLSREVAAQGIRVNGVRPGFIYTEMHASGGEPRPGGSREGQFADAARRPSAGSSGGDRLVAVRRRVLRDRHFYRGCRRALNA